MGDRSRFVCFISVTKCPDRRTDSGCPPIASGSHVCISQWYANSHAPINAECTGDLFPSPTNELHNCAVKYV